jgi:hypothetical protein
MSKPDDGLVLVTNEKLIPVISLRQHYAGLAMQGLLAGGLKLVYGPGESFEDQVAECAFRFADAMIAAEKAGRELILKRRTKNNVKSRNS